MQSVWEGDTAVFQVSDTGIGMTSEEQARVFQLYYQAENDEPLRTRGKGIGLFIVKMLVEAHHGRIVLESEPRAGSCFTIYLPKFLPPFAA